eukprot:IDg18364t1
MAGRAEVEDETSMAADVLNKFLTYTLSVFRKEWSSVVAVIVIEKLPSLMIAILSLTVAAILRRLTDQKPFQAVQNAGVLFQNDQALSRNDASSS